MSFRAVAAALWLMSVGCIVTIVASASNGALGNVPLVGNMLQQPHFWDRATPIAILSLFTWVLIELAFKAKQVRVQHRAIPTMQALIAQADVNRHQTIRTIRNEPRAVRRANLIIECNRRDPSGLHGAVPAAAGLDANTLAASYGPLNVYAWVLPVLGFIGTANGMAAAIAGFKSALGTTSQFEKLVGTLSHQVIPGLSAAFETTILALGASLVAYLCTSALRAWDEEALDHLDRICVVLLSRIPQPPSAEGPEIVRLLQEISNQLVTMVIAPESLQSAAAAIDKAAQALSTASLELKDSATLDVQVVRGRR